MSHRLENILASYDDHELAVMHHYLYNTYLPATRQKIDAFLFQRGLDKQRLAQLLAEKQKKRPVVDDEEKQCSRCGSMRITIFEQKPGRSAMVAQPGQPIHAGSLYTCQVCGHTQQMLGTPRSAIKYAIKKLLGMANQAIL